MLGEIVSILTDRERHSRERRNINIPSGMQCKDVWSDVLAEARRRGLSVNWVDGYVEIGVGSFQDNEGGAMMAREMLRGV